jgi:hypothetical protein
MELTQDYVDKKFEGLYKFLRENMVTKEDLQSLKTDLPTKASIDNLSASVDGLAKQTKDYRQEVIFLQSKTERMEEWIKQAAAKLGLEYKL